MWLKLDIPGREGAEITAWTIANKTAKDLQGHILFWTSIELFLKKITSTLYVLNSGVYSIVDRQKDCLQLFETGCTSSFCWTAITQLGVKLYGVCKIMFLQHGWNCLDWHGSSNAFKSTLFSSSIKSVIFLLTPTWTGHATQRLCVMTNASFRGKKLGGEITCVCEASTFII